MDSLRTEIESELKRTRLDKTRLYTLLLKIIDNAGESAPGSVGPQGPPGPKGPAGPRGPACECKCVTKTTTTTKKATTKKKVVA